MKKRNRYKYTDEQIQEGMNNCTSVFQLIEWLGGTVSTGLHSHLSKRIKKAGLVWPHYLGQRCNSGKKFENKRRTPEEIFAMTNAKTKMLRRALLAIGRECICENCGQGEEWNSTKLVLHIHHRNSNHFDNRPENLVFLCPNCHSQVEHRRTAHTLKSA